MAGDNQKKIRIFALVLSRFTGGAEISLAETFKTIDRHRFDISVIIPEDSSEELVSLYESAGINIIKTQLPNIKKCFNPLKIFNTFKQIKSSAKNINNIIREQSGDTYNCIIHSNNNHAAILSAFIKNNSAKKIWHCRDISLPLPVRKFLGKKHDHIIAVSNFVKNHCEKFADPGKISTVYSPIDFNKFISDYHDNDCSSAKKKARELLHLDGKKSPYILNVGNFAKWKNQQQFIELVAYLKHKYPDIVGIIAGKTGSGNQHTSDSLRKYAEKLGITENIKFIDLPHEKMKLLYLSCDLLVNFADNEPLGRSIIEAMICKLPVLSVEGGGVEEILRLTGCGNTYPQNHLNNFACNMLERLSDIRRRNDSNYANTIELLEQHFSPQHSSKQIEQIYATLI